MFINVWEILKKAYIDEEASGGQQLPFAMKGEQEDCADEESSEAEQGTAMAAPGNGGSKDEEARW